MEIGLVLLIVWIADGIDINVTMPRPVVISIAVIGLEQRRVVMACAWFMLSTSANLKIAFLLFQHFSVTYHFFGHFFTSQRFSTFLNTFRATYFLLIAVPKKVAKSAFEYKKNYNNNFSVLLT